MKTTLSVIAALFLYVTLTSQSIYMTSKLSDLKLEITIENKFKEINKLNLESRLSMGVGNEPSLMQGIQLIKNGVLPAVLFVKSEENQNDKNILINQMQGYSKMDSSLIPKIKESQKQLNDIHWKSVSLVTLENKYKAIKLSDFFDKTNPGHTNVTFWVEDTKHRRWVSFSFNNMKNNEVLNAVNSIKFY